MKSESILSASPMKLDHPWSYSHSFQSLPWNRRMLNYIGSGKLLSDYEFQRRRGVPIDQSKMVYAQLELAVKSVEDLVLGVVKSGFYAAMGEYWKAVVRSDNGTSEQDVCMAAMLRIAMDATFPGHPDLLEMRNWPLWKLVAYVPENNSSSTVVFNEATKESAYSRIVQAHLDREEGDEWLISDVSSVKEDGTDSACLILDFCQFADPLIGNAFAIPVHVPDEQWTEGSRLDFVYEPSFETWSGNVRWQGSRGT